MLPAEVLHGLTYAAMWTASTSYANEIAPGAEQSVPSTPRYLKSPVWVIYQCTYLAGLVFLKRGEEREALKVAGTRTEVRSKVPCRRRIWLAHEYGSCEWNIDMMPHFPPEPCTC